MAIGERITGFFRREQAVKDVRGDLSRLAIDRCKIPRPITPVQLFDEEVARSIRTAVGRGMRFESTVYLNLPPSLVELAKERGTTLWFTPVPQQPFWISGRRWHGPKDIFWTDPDGSATLIRNSIFRAQELMEKLKEMPRVRILPGEVDELKTKVEACRQIVEETPRDEILSRLGEQHLHPVDIFREFAGRRAA